MYLKELTCEIVHALHKQENIHCVLVFALEVDDVSIALHNKRTYFYCPTMLMWCNLLLLMAIKVIKVCTVYANFSSMCLQTG